MASIDESDDFAWEAVKVQRNKDHRKENPSGKTSKKSTSQDSRKMHSERRQKSGKQSSQPTSHSNSKKNSKEISTTQTKEKNQEDIKSISMIPSVDMNASFKAAIAEPFDWSKRIRDQPPIVDPIIEEIDELSASLNATLYPTTSEAANITHKEPIHLSELDSSILFRKWYLHTSSSIPSHLEYQPRGCINTGSTCFRNVVFQSLFSLPSFAHCLQSISNQISDAKLPQNMPLWSEIFQLAKVLYPNDSHSDSNIGKKKLFNPLAIDLFIPTLLKRFWKSVGLTDEEIQQAMEREKRAIMNPIYCKSNFHSIQSSANVGGQQDAMEFLTFVLDGLHEELLQIEKQIPEDSMETLQKNWKLIPHDTRVSTIHHLQNDNDNEIEENEEWTEVSIGFKMEVDEPSRVSTIQGLTQSIISILYHGVLRSEVRYLKRNTSSVTFQRFHCLTLSVGEYKKKTLSVEEALDCYFREEPLDPQRINKQVYLQNLPEILMIHVGKFSFDYYRNIPTKIPVELSFTDHLVLKESYLAPGVLDSLGGNLPSYNLHAAILHHGKSAIGGHYSAYIRGNTSDWWHVNDANVEPISAYDLSTARDRVYILCYSRSR